MRKLITKLNSRLIFTVLLLVTIFVISGCSSKNQPVNNEVNNKTENVNNSTTDTQNPADNNTVADTNNDTPVENTADETKQDDPVDAGLLLGRYYDDSELHYIEISEGLHYEMYGPTDDGYISSIDCGYIEKLDEMGNYLVTPTLYVDDKPFEIFQFDIGILLWNEESWEFKTPEEYPDIQPVNANGEYGYLLPGRYYSLVGGEVDFNYYIDISEDFKYEMMVANVSDPDGAPLIDCGYITPTSDSHTYIATPELYVTDEPFEIYATPDGFIDWSVSTNPGVNMWHHGSDAAEE